MESKFNKIITDRFFSPSLTIVLLLSVISSLHALDPLEDVTILPGQSMTFSKTLFNSEATSYSITVSKPSFITFTDLGAERFMSSITLKFQLSVSLSAPGGTHEVNITYRFNAGFPSWVPFTYNVYTGPSEPAPVANFIGTPTSGTKPLTVQFTDQSTGAITSRSWSFGDGQSSTAPNPSHIYQNAGNYTVSLTVTGPGGSDTKTRSDYITVSACFWADIDCDEDVDVVDIQIVAGRWNTKVGDPKYDSICDVDNEGQGDGDIDVVDIQLVAGWWNKPIPPGSGSSMLAKASEDVPENVTLRVTSPVPSGERTGSYYVDVMIENAVDLGAFQFDFVSQDKELKIEGIELGRFMKNSGNRIIPLWPERNTERNKLTFGAYSYGENSGASGAGVLARITLTYSRDNVLPMELDNVQITDTNGNLIPVNRMINANVAETALSTVPKSFFLSQNYPNPFNPTTKIDFDIPDIDGKSVRVWLYIYNLKGQLVRKMVDEEKAPGSYSVKWNGTNDGGKKMSSGIYFYSIVAGDFKVTRKMTLIE